MMGNNGAHKGRRHSGSILRLEIKKRVNYYGFIEMRRLS
jgi:hypothetical protein